MKKILLLLIVIIFSTLSHAQNGTAGAQELLLPVGAKSLAMQNSFVAGISGIEAIYYNPAGLASNVNDIDAMFTYMNFIADINLSYAAAAANLGEGGTLALNLKTIDLGDIPVTTTQQPYGTGENFSPTLMVAGLSYGKNISDNISLGIGVNIIHEKIIETSATGVSFDLGFQYHNIGIEGLMFGGVVKNLGPNMKFDGPELLRTAVDTTTRRENQLYKIESDAFELPLQFDFGLAYENQFENVYSYVATFSFSSSSYFENEIKFAGEFSYDNMFFVRGGYFFNSQNVNDDRTIFGPSFGAGINLKTIFNISVDYAYRVSSRFNSNQMFTVKIGF